MRKYILMDMSTKKANGEKLLKLSGIYGFERRTKNMAKWILDETYNDGYELLKDDHLYGE